MTEVDELVSTRTTNTGVVVSMPHRGRSTMPVEALTHGFDLSQVIKTEKTQLQVQQLAVTASSAGNQARQGFRVGTLQLMIRYEDGSQLIEMPQIYRLPNVPAWFRGMANLYGMLTPVFDLSRYIGVEPQAGAKQMLLVLSHGANAAGILIDGMPERLRWTEAERTETDMAPDTLAPHLRGACLIGDGLWFYLETMSLLDALELSMGAPQ